MNQPNRTIAPETQKIIHLGFPVCTKISGKTGVNIYHLFAPVDEVLRVEFVFDAGIAKQTQKLIATGVNRLLTEGTQTKTAEQIADSLDFYGSYLQTRCTVDDAQLTLYCLKKHLLKCLEIVLDVIKNAQFPDNEIDIYKKNNKQRLKVQQQKTSYLCRRAFYETLFGETSPISSYSLPIDYEKFSRETLVEFHRKYYANTIKYITLSGDVDNGVIEQLSQFSASFNPSQSDNKYKNEIIIPESKIIKKEKSAQATLRVGRKIINRSHTDYRKLQLVNLVLGGYFGSRLMKNIREDKGLTYGIYSVLESYLDDGCFYVEADVNNDKTHVAIEEIYKEINTLCVELIPEKELSTAKNYLLGSLLRSIDGPFTIVDRNRILIDYGFKSNYYDEFIEIINTTTSEELRDLCNKYLKPENLVEITCGA
jgi:predicted Zn-dependent peptidase